MDGLIVDNITRPGESAESWFINLDGKFRVNDKLTIRTQVGYTYGVGDTPRLNRPSRSTGSLGFPTAPSGNGFAAIPYQHQPAKPRWPGQTTGRGTRASPRSTRKSTARSTVSGTSAAVSGKMSISAFTWTITPVRLTVGTRMRTIGGSVSAPVCYGSPNIPFAATNPTSYPGGYNSGALGIPGLLIPIGGNPTTIGQIIDSTNRPVRGAIYARSSSPSTTTGLARSRSRRPTARAPSWRTLAERAGAVTLLACGSSVLDQSSYVNAPDATSPTRTGGNNFSFTAYNYFINDIHHNYVWISRNRRPSTSPSTFKKNLLLRFSAAETMARPDLQPSSAASESFFDLLQVGNDKTDNIADQSRRLRH